MFRTQLINDKLAMALSSACAIHCFLTPSFVLLLFVLLDFDFVFPRKSFVHFLNLFPRNQFSFSLGVLVFSLSYLSLACLSLVFWLCSVDLHLESGALAVVHSCCYPFILHHLIYLCYCRHLSFFLIIILYFFLLQFLGLDVQSSCSFRL